MYFHFVIVLLFFLICNLVKRDSLTYNSATHILIAIHGLANAKLEAVYVTEAWGLRLLAVSWLPVMLRWKCC